MKIAAFDSGIGGLSALAPLLKTCPDLHVTYLGDLANLPYGTKSPSRVKDLATANVRFLLDHCRHRSPVDLLLLACNTASAYALRECTKVAENFGLPVLGVIQASCLAALRARPQRILILATKGTRASHAYRDQLLAMGFEGFILEIACPLFVPLVEEGITEGPAAEWIVRSYLDPLVRAGDTVILGCTHYPYLSGVLEKTYPELRWVQAGEALLQEAPEFRSCQQIGKSPKTAGSSLEILFTDEPDRPDRVETFLKSLGLSQLSVSQQKILPLL